MRITLFAHHLQLLHNINSQQSISLRTNMEREREKIEFVTTIMSKSLTQMRTRWGSSSATPMTAISSIGNSETNPSLFIKFLQFHSTNSTRNQQNKQKNAETASQNKWSRACGRAKKAPSYPPTPANCNGLGDRRLRDAIRRLPIKSPEGSPATIKTRSFSFLAPAAAPPPFPWQWDEKGALKWELKRQQGSKLEERAYWRGENFSQHLHIVSLSAKPKTRAQESWATKKTPVLCASCVRRERVEVEPPLGRARRRRTRHNLQGARTFHDSNIWGSRFCDFLGHIIYQNLPVMIYTRNKSERLY